MAGDNHKNDNGIETAWIKELASILDETGLTEIEVEKDDIRLRVAREAAPIIAAGASAQTAPLAAPAPSPDATPPRPASNPGLAGAAGAHPGAVRSPMVGTAYLSPSPGADPFIKVGTSVSEGQTIMIVEAMKTMNPIPAPRSGAIKEILVSDAQPVEYDEPLVIIE